MTCKIGIGFPANCHEHLHVSKSETNLNKVRERNFLEHQIDRISLPVLIGAFLVSYISGILSIKSLCIHSGDI